MRYPEAVFALELAYGARVPRIDQDRDARYSVNSDGTRAFVSRWEDPTHPDQDSFPQAIIDPRDGRLIAELDPQIRVHGVTTPGISASFSPDGSILALPSNETSIVHLYAAEDGAYIGEMKPSPEASGGKSIGYEAGFNQDGRLYARAYSVLRTTGIDIWDVRSRDLIHNFQTVSDKTTRQVPLGWDHEDGLIVQTTRSDPDRKIPDKIIIERWKTDGTKSALVSREGRKYDMDVTAFAYPETGLLFLAGEQGLEAVDMSTGQLRFSHPMIGPFAALARDAHAVVLRPRSLVQPDAFTVLDLDGNELAIRGNDAIPFMHDVFSPGGNRITMSTGLLQTTYAGAGAPQGLTLYERVWSEMSEAERRNISVERVPRP
ncbi:WD40 repeat domain-containing protein [Paracoccus aurantiacus]|uniref:WD40 repeat domain-containing protein n=1 Tax=Paracoccus aurantiacus TaxID=2599412 RepID=A0A5C6RYK1_9RHOB|nr:WD40 repeat domain-containing protein [Paracoccus aurantiacus]TXB67468.1 WD40 repeat domain-containing protein [Paracoccus aurantiacus]